MKQRIFSHFQDYLIQYISHQYQDLLYCNSSQYILSNNNNNVVLASGSALMATCVRPAQVTPIYQLIGRSGNPDLTIG